MLTVYVAEMIVKMRKDVKAVPLYKVVEVFEIKFRKPPDIRL